MTLKLNELLEIAKEAARLGAGILTNGEENLKVAEYGKPHDVKIKADELTEEKIIAFLEEKTSIKIISEESWKQSPQNISDQDEDLYWIVDPLDGSYNFLHDIPLCCISIALWRGKREPLLGVIHDFNRNEVFYGGVGMGASMNGSKIAVSNSEDISKSVLCTGFPVNLDFSEDNLSVYIQKVRKWGKVRLFGSAALSLSYVAKGRVDGYFEGNIMFWDVAAGISLVLAAGGEVDYAFTKDLKMNVFASNGHQKSI